MNCQMQLYVAVLFCYAGACSAQERIVINQADKEQLLKIVEDAPAFKEVPTSKSAPRRYLTEFSAVRSMVDGKSTRIATVVHYEYENGQTIRTIVDLDAREVKEVRRFEAFSTPLSPEERLEAIQFALRHVSEVRELLNEEPPPEITAMPWAILDKDSIQYGHRVASLLIVSRSRPSSGIARVEVDLTEGTAKRTDSTSTGNATRLDSAKGPEVVEQHFPAQVPATDKRTAWKVTFGVDRFGSGDLLHIKQAEYKPSPSSGWIKVLDECRPFEMFVPYHSGSPRFYDFTEIGGSLLPLDATDLGPACLGQGRIVCNDRVGIEIHDGHNSWIDHYQPSPGKSRRVEELQIWGVRTAGNYVYPILYVFRSDGSVSFRVGATAHNYHSSLEDSASHFHLSTWRLNVPVGDATKTKIHVVRNISSAAQGPVSYTDVAPFNNEKEGFLDWNPQELTLLRLESTLLQNEHNPQHLLSYELMPLRMGNVRTFGPHEEWTHHDFWVTLPTKASGGDWTTVKELPECLAAPRALTGKAVTIFAMAGAVHRPRDEDFGPVGTYSADGVAVTVWSVVELRPRNVHAATPMK
jgi:Copper amine oxidase, enzyme domain